MPRRSTASLANDLAESATSLLLETRRQAKLGTLGERRGRIRRYASLSGSVTAAQIQREAMFVRCLSIAEAYTDGLLLILTRESLDNPADLILRALDELELHATASWPARHDAYLRVLSVDLKEVSVWWSLRGAADVRNGIAHGLGTLTPPLRLDTAKTERAVAQIGVELGGGRFHLGDHAFENVLRVCRTYVDELLALAVTNARPGTA